MRKMVMLLLPLWLVLALFTAEPAWAAEGAPRVSVTKFLELVRSDQVATAVVTAQGGGVAPLTAKLRDGKEIGTVLPGHYQTALALMLEHKVDVEIQAAGFPWINTAPFLMLLGFWLVMLWMMRSGKLPKFR